MVVVQCFLAEPTVTTEKPRAVHTKSVRSHVAGTDHKAGQGKSGITALCSLKRGVAQLGSAGALGALGRRFESCRPDCRYCKGFRGFPEPLFFVLQRKMHAKRVDDLLEPLRAGALRQAATGSEPLGGESADQSSASNGTWSIHRSPSPLAQNVAAETDDDPGLIPRGHAHQPPASDQSAHWSWPGTAFAPRPWAPDVQRRGNALATASVLLLAPAGGDQRPYRGTEPWRPPFMGAQVEWVVSGSGLHGFTEKKQKC